MLQVEEIICLLYTSLAKKKLSKSNNFDHDDVIHSTSGSNCQTC